MPYQYILANLLADAEEALGVVFVDEEGEIVDFAAKQDSEVDFQLMGAYLGIYAQRVVSLAREEELGQPQLLYIDCQGLTILVSSLSGGYSLGVVQDSSTGLGRISRSLERAAADLEREVLSAIH